MNGFDETFVKNTMITFFEMFIDTYHGHCNTDFKNAMTGSSIVARRDWKNPEEKEYGVLFTLRINCENFGYEKDGNTFHEDWQHNAVIYVHYIILGSRKVFYAINCSPDAKVEEFKNTSNHNSCWSSDGFHDLFNVYMRLYKECWENPNIPEDQRVKPCHADFYTDMQRPKFVLVSHTATKDERGITEHYWRQITKIEMQEAFLTIGEKRLTPFEKDAKKTENLDKTI